MSTKESLFLTKSNEHWYRDYIQKEAIVLEFDRNHAVKFQEDGCFEVVVEEGTALFKTLRSLK